tara:strand:+ start:5494 stop:6240 length:747 start_codon:yes stop_codon:yes gene_type:complete
MRTDEANRTRRLYPKRFTSRYYGLKRLAEAMEITAKQLATTKHGGRPTVVDLGCGSMPYRPLFLPHAEAYHGVDIDSNPDADIKLDPDSYAVNLPDNTADIILSTQVLEHVAMPQQYLTEARRLCRPDGRLILSTHGMFKYHPHPADYRRWTAQGLTQELAQAGWHVEQITGILGFAAAAFLLLQDAIVTKLPRIGPLRSFCACILQQVVGLLDLLYSEEERQENAAVFLVVATCEHDSAVDSDREAI